MASLMPWGGGQVAADCQACTVLRPDWECYSCMDQGASISDPNIIRACLACVGEGQPAWACLADCTQLASRPDEVAACTSCLATPGLDPWACGNCMALAQGDDGQRSACFNCVMQGGDAYGCGQCLAQPTPAARDACVTCMLALPPAANTWNCWGSVN
ncbi:hypothetical protein V8C86DRAFT_67180 [Haematococcus lacustris]